MALKDEIPKDVKELPDDSPSGTDVFSLGSAGPQTRMQDRMADAVDEQTEKLLKELPAKIAALMKLG